MRAGGPSGAQIAAWAFLCVLGACGGSGGSSTGSENDASTTGSDAGGSGSSGSSGAEAAASSSGATDGSSGGGASSSGGHGGSSGSSGAEGGGGDAGVDDAAIDDAGADGPGGPSGVACGNELDASAGLTRCSGAQACCVTGAPTFACQPANTACNGTVLECTKNADCPQGQVCCGLLAGTVPTGYPTVSCMTECLNEASAEANEFCDLHAPDCPASKTCRASLYLPGYTVCAP